MGSSWLPWMSDRLSVRRPSNILSHIITDYHNFEHRDRDRVTIHDPWYHAICKVKKAINRPTWTEPDIDEMTGRCQRLGRKCNYIIAELVEIVHEITRRSSDEKLYIQRTEVDQLSFLKKRIHPTYAAQAGLHHLHNYKPGRQSREDAKLLIAAAFLVESEHPQLRRVAAANRRIKEDITRSRAASTYPPQPETAGSSVIPYTSLVGAKDDHATLTSREDKVAPDQYNPPTARNCVEQAMLKMNKWADSWLTAKIGSTDSAWESFEFCLSAPDIVERPDPRTRTLVYKIPAKRRCEVMIAKTCLPDKYRPNHSSPVKEPTLLSEYDRETHTPKRVRVSHSPSRADLRHTHSNARCTQYLHSSLDSAPSFAESEWFSLPIPEVEGLFVSPQEHGSGTLRRNAPSRAATFVPL